MAGREQVIAALQAAYVQGRLTKEEFDLRVGQALAIYAELDALTADIPAAPPAVLAPAAAEPGVTARAELARETANKKMIRQGTTGVAGLTFVLVTALGAPHNPALALTVAALLTCFVTVLTAGLLTLLSWAMDRRSGAQCAGGAGGARPVHGSPPGTADQQGRQPELGQDPPGTVQAASRRPHRLATSPAWLVTGPLGRADIVMKSRAHHGSKNVHGPCWVVASSLLPLDGAAGECGLAGV
jgi:hypothetical protein